MTPHLQQLQSQAKALARGLNVAIADAKQVEAGRPKPAPPERPTLPESWSLEYLAFTLRKGEAPIVVEVLARIPPEPVEGLWGWIAALIKGEQCLKSCLWCGGRFTSALYPGLMVLGCGCGLAAIGRKVTGKAPTINLD